MVVLFFQVDVTFDSFRQVSKIIIFFIVYLVSLYQKLDIEKLMYFILTLTLIFDRVPKTFH